jgi:hypothetical protein
MIQNWEKHEEKKKSEAFTVDEIEKYLNSAPNDNFHYIREAVAAIAIPGLLRGIEVSEIMFGDVQLHAAIDTRMYSVKIHRKKQKGPKIQSRFIITSKILVSAIDN